MKKRLIFAITALGISSIITQLLVMREFLSVFYGNELVFGIILANWLLLNGLGSYIGRYVDKIKKKIRLLAIAQIIIAFLPFTYIYTIRVLRNMIFLPGELISIPHIFASSFLLLLPYCLTSGFLLTLACVVFSFKKDAKQIGKVYFIDNIGDILGGFLFSFILIFFFNPFQMVMMLMLLNFIAAFVLAQKQKAIRAAIAIILIISLFIFFKYDLNELSTKAMFKGQQLIEQKTSIYGNLVVTQSLDQLNFFESGMPLFSTENTVANEETTHYSMIQHKNPKSILLISGGAAGTTSEILKYGVKRIDYVELDPSIIELGKKYTKNLDDERINIIEGDGRLFIKKTKSKYDVAIIDLPDPSTAQINRFYTAEFFKELKRTLNEDAVISLSISSSENYMSEETKKFNAVIYQTLKKSFKNIIIIPGDKNFFIASNKELSYDIAELIEEKGIETKYVNENFLKGKITEERIKYVEEAVKEEIKTNKDFSPIAYYYHLLFWKSHFEFNVTWGIIIAAILLCLVLIKIRPVTFSIFTTGFAASSLEIVLLIGFQILYGYVYHMIGVIITMFMLGLAIGAYYMNKTLEKKKLKDFVKLEFMIAAYATALPIIMILFSYIKNGFISLLSANIGFPIMAIIIGMLTGMEFPLASKLHFKKVSKTAGTLYASDLIGACIGAVLASALLIPLLGLVKACLLIAALNLISGLIVWKK